MRTITGSCVSAIIGGVVAVSVMFAVGLAPNEVSDAKIRERIEAMRATGAIGEPLPTVRTRKLVVVDDSGHDACVIEAKKNEVALVMSHADGRTIELLIPVMTTENQFSGCVSVNLAAKEGLHAGISLYDKSHGAMTDTAIVRAVTSKSVVASLSSKADPSGINDSADLFLSTGNLSSLATIEACAGRASLDMWGTRDRRMSIYSTKEEMGMRSVRSCSDEPKSRSLFDLRIRDEYGLLRMSGTAGVPMTAMSYNDTSAHSVTCDIDSPISSVVREKFKRENCVYEIDPEAKK